MPVESPSPRSVLLLESGAGFGGSVVCLAKLVRGLRMAGFETHSAVLHSTQESRNYLSREPTPVTYLQVYRRPASVSRTLVSFSSRSRLAKRVLLSAILAGEWVLHRATQAAVARLIRRHRPEILALNNGFEPTLVGVAARLGLGRRILIHGRGLCDRPATFGGGQYPLLVAMSNSIASSYIEAGWPADRALVVYDPFPVLPTPGPPADWRALSDCRRTVVHVASLQAWKGHFVFIDAAAMLVPKFPNVTFLIVGGETLAEPDFPLAIAARIRDLGVGNSVRTAGWRHDVNAIVAASDVVVHASTSPEPFGNVVPEALSLGKAVVAANAGGPREVIRHGVDGFLSTPGSAADLASHIACLLENDDLRAHLGARGKERVRDLLSEERFVKNLRSAYERVLAQ